MYVRSPGGVLVECTANVTGGFYQDEAPEELGTKLHLPPWYEEQRDEIVSRLEPLRVPEAFRPKPSVAATRSAPAPVAARTSSIALSRTRADFAGKDR
jgi:hypothetical protein